jgi:hypothetical protein
MGVLRPWVITTDLLFTSGGRSPVSRKLLAVACKPKAELDDRTKKLLAIERAYWAARDVEWLLITPDQYDEVIELTLRTSFQWWLGENRSRMRQRTAKPRTWRVSLKAFPLTYVLDRLEDL